MNISRPYAIKLKKSCPAIPDTYIRLYSNQGTIKPCPQPFPVAKKSGGPNMRCFTHGVWNRREVEAI